MLAELAETVTFSGPLVARSAGRRCVRVRVGGDGRVVVTGYRAGSAVAPLRLSPGSAAGEADAEEYGFAVDAAWAATGRAP